MTFVRALTLLLIAVVAVPIQSSEPVDLEAIAKIRDEGLKRSQVQAMFTMLVDGIGPRLAGSPEYKRAAEWAQKQLAGWGLEKPRLEAFEFGRGWTLDKFTLEMVEPRYMPLLGYPEAWSPSTAGEVTASIVVVNGKTGDEAAKMPLKGAAVMQAALVTNFIAADRGQPSQQPDQPANAARQGGTGRQGGGGGNRGRGAGAEGQPGAPAPLTLDQAIRAGGAAVLLKPSRGMHGTVFVQAGRDNPNDLLPKVVVAGEHYNMLMRLAQQGLPGKVRV